MYRRLPSVLVLVVLALSASRSTGADSSADAIEKALNAYCEQKKIERSGLQPCELNLIPGAKVFRYELAAKLSVPRWMSLETRYAVVFVEPRSGRVVEFKRDQFDGATHPAYSQLFEEMKGAGRTVKSDEEATQVLRQLMLLEDWTWSTEASDERTKEINVHGTYRGRANTYSCGYFAWVGGDDLGLEVDADGHVVQLLGGHIR